MQLAVKRLVTLDLHAMKFLPKRLQVVKDLSPPRREIRRQCGIDPRKLVVETVKLLINVFFCIHKKLCGTGAYETLDNGRQKRVESGKEGRKIEFEFLQKTLGLWVEKRDALPVKNGRRRSFQEPVNDAVLCEVCYLRAAAK